MRHLLFLPSTSHPVPVGDPGGPLGGHPGSGRKLCDSLTKTEKEKVTPLLWLLSAAQFHIICTYLAITYFYHTPISIPLKLVSVYYYVVSHTFIIASKFYIAKLVGFPSNLAATSPRLLPTSSSLPLGRNSGDNSLRVTASRRDTMCCLLMQCNQR